MSNNVSVVISQPMFLPWYGFFEQVKLSNYFVHYDDVQAPTGKGGTNFITRVQIKTNNGITWLRIPISRRDGRYKPINNTLISNTVDWRKEHLTILSHCYKKAPYFNEMFSLAERIYSYQTDILSEFNIYSIELIASFLGFNPIFVRSSTMNIPGYKTQRIVDICRQIGASTYYSGLGGLNYIEHEKFEEHNIEVRYMNYFCLEYPQLHGDFTPYVSILDMIANCGKNAVNYMQSKTISYMDAKLKKENK